MTLHDICIALRREYGSDRAAAAAYGITPGQWNKLKNWNKRPMQSTLDKLGIEEVRTYRFKDGTVLFQPKSVDCYDDPPGSEPVRRYV